MKKLVLLSLAIGLSFLSLAQAPQLINYQAVIRDATGQVVQNQNVSLRLSIHEKYSVGINVYQEEHMVTTNDFGLVNIHIGAGVNKTGLLNDVKWGSDVHVLKVSLDQNGGSSFSVMGYAQLVSVPYALYAANVSYADTSATNELQMLSFANDTLRLSNGNSIYLPNTDYSKNISDLNDSIMVINSKLVSVTQQVKNDSIYLAGLINSHVQNDADIDSTNEVQNLSLAGNTLSISKGNSVVLPGGSAQNNDNDSTNEIQSLSRNSDTLFISQSNYIVLPSGSVNTDDQNLNLSGDTLYIEDGTPVVLTKYLNTDGQSLSLSGNNLSISGGNSVTLPAGGSSNDNDSTNEIQNLTLSSDTMFISKGNYVVLPSGSVNTDDQNLNLSGDTLYIENGTAVFLSKYLDNTDSQSLSLSGSTLSISGGNSVTLPAGGAPNNDNDSTNEIQSLSLSGNSLSISGGNSVTLASGTVNNDNDSTNELISSFILSNDTLSITDAAGTKLVGLGTYMDNTDAQALSMSGDTIYLSNGGFVKLPAATSGFDGDSSSTNEIQALSMSGDTIYLTNGGFVKLPAATSGFDGDSSSTNELISAFVLSNDTLSITDASGTKQVGLATYMDNTDAQALSMSGDTIYLSNGGFVKLPAATSGFDGDSSSTNELQSLSISGNSLTILNGNTVTLPAAPVSNDNDSTNELNSQVQFTGTTLTITDGGGAKSANLSSLLDNTDSQALSVSGSTLSISGGNSVTLPAGGGPNNDNDSTNELISAFVLSNDTLSITDASGIKQVGLATYMDNTDSQALSMSGDTIYLSNGGFVKLPAATSGFDGDSSSTNEIQALTLSSDTLSLSKSNYIVLPSGTINTDDQNLALSNDTLKIESGNYVVLPSSSVNLDNDSTNELQTLSISGNTLSISNGNSVTLASGAVNNDNDSTNELNSAIGFSGTTLTVTDAGGAKTANLSSLLDNTDSQSLSISGNSLSISGGNSVTLPAGTISNDNDSTNELNASVSVSGNILSVTDAGGAKTADLSAFKDNTDSQTLSLSGSTLSIAGGNSVTLPAGTASNDNDSTNELNSAFAITSNNLTVTDAGGAKTVSLAPYLDNTDAQTLSITGNTLSITGGNNVTLPSGSTYTTKGIDSVLTAGNNAAGLNMLNVGKMAIGTATADSTLTVSGGINANNIRLSNGAGANKILTSDASGNASWVSPSTVTAPSEIKDTDNDTKIQVEESSDEDIIRFDIAGNERWRMEGTHIEPVGTGGSVFIGDNAGQNDDLSANNNTFIGNNSGQTNSTGYANSAIGYNSMAFNTSGRENVSVGLNAMYNNTTGIRNAVIGCQALFTNTTGLGNVAMGYRALRTSSNKHYNIGIGYDALYNNNGTGNIGMGFYALRANVSGSYNAAIGYRSLGSNVSGQRNIAFGFYSALDMLTGSFNITIGDYALNNNINGSNNVVVGRNAGFNNVTGSRNVFIGYQAGYSETGTDKLYIDASTSAASSTSPLIYGDFATDELKINGDLEVRDDFTLPTGAGSGRILTSDANGKASWSNPGAVSLGDTTQVSDLDGDTKIQMEESSDEDIIRFDLAGKQQWRMVGARLEANNSGLSVFIGEEAGQTDDLSNNQNVFIGYRSGRNNSTGQLNTAIGSNSLRNNTTGNYNTSTGYYSLNANLTGQQNSAYGYYSLGANTSGAFNAAFGLGSLRSNSSGVYNAATGYYALFSNTTGTFNASVGANSLRRNTTGYRNSSIGYYSLGFNTTGYRNSGLGMYSLYRNSTGYDNTASGYYSLGLNTTGYENAAVGTNALYQNTSGNRNAAIGHRAGFYGQTGAQNTYLGSYAGPSSNVTYSNATAVGYNSTTTASNQVRIGNTSVTSIGGQVGWSTLSDGRFKENVKSDVVGLDFIMKLEPVTYTLKTGELFSQFEDKDSIEVYGQEVDARIEKSKITQTGFIAQDVEKAAQETGYAFSGVDAPKNDKDMYGLRYSEFVVPLVKGMQEQQKLIQAQQELIKKLEKRITALEK
ncbi:tail fiber domain-containing protein [Salibacteraceae bacterium]|nr:tail fiber domain-containing protein [Salibacteraceae bacterium]